MFATIPSQRSVVRPLTLVPSAQLKETMLTSVTRDQSSRRRALKAASSHKPDQYPYTVCKQSASYFMGFVRIPCPVVVVASSPTFEPQLAALQRLKSTCGQSHAQPTHLRCAVLGPSQPNEHHRALDVRFHLDPPGSISRSTVSRRSCQAQWGCDLRTAFTTAVWPPLAAETASPCPPVYRSLSKVIKTFSLSSSWCFVVRSLTLLYVPTFFNENRPACTTS